jgi:hypothetical protein
LANLVAIGGARGAWYGDAPSACLVAEDVAELAGKLSALGSF